MCPLAGESNQNEWIDGCTVVGWRPPIDLPRVSARVIGLGISASVPLILIVVGHSVKDGLWSNNNQTRVRPSRNDLQQ